MLPWKFRRPARLLLGSVAILLVVRTGEAAAATPTEPVDYAKVCDAFGAGFFYSAGTDTCIKVGGYVKFGTNVNGYRYDYSYYQDSATNWGSFYTEASLQFTASTVTEYGNLTGWIDLRARTGSGYGRQGSDVGFYYLGSVAGTDADGHIDSAYLELGGLKAGHFTSAFDYLGGYTDFGAFRADQSTDHIQYTYALGNFGIIGSIEDGSDRVLRTGVTGDTGAPYYYSTYGVVDSGTPDIVAALTYASGPFNAKFSAAYVPREVYGGDSGWATQLGVEVALDGVSPGDKFGVQGVFANNAPAYTGLQKYMLNYTEYLEGNAYGGFLSYLHYWRPSLWSAAEFSYLHHEWSENWESMNIWQVSASTDWAIVKNLDFMLDGSYAHGSYPNYPGDYDDVWSVNLWLKRSW